MTTWSRYQVPPTPPCCATWSRAAVCLAATTDEWMPWNHVHHWGLTQPHAPAPCLGNLWIFIPQNLSKLEAITLSTTERLLSLSSNLEPSKKWPQLWAVISTCKTDRDFSTIQETTQQRADISNSFQVITCRDRYTHPYACVHDNCTTI